MRSLLILGACALALALSTPALAADVLIQHEGAADPLTEGWSFYRLSFPVPDVGPVFNDLGSGVDAWRVAGDGIDYGFYLQTLTPSEVARGDAEGWQFRVDARVVGTPLRADHTVFYRPRADESWQFNLGVEGNDVLVSVLGYPGPTREYRIPGGAAAYHAYEMAFDAVSNTVNLYVDDSLVLADLPGYHHNSDSRWVAWGDGSYSTTGPSGNVHFKTVTFSVGARNTAPVARAGADRVVECGGLDVNVVDLDGSMSFDPDGDPITFDWSVAAGSGALIEHPTAPQTTGRFPLGQTLVTLTVMDDEGAIDCADVLITVVDTTAPLAMCSTDRIALWPPNHQMVPVSVTLVPTDTCTAPGDLAVTCLVRSNEPDDANGDGVSTGDVDGEDGYSQPVSVALVYDADTGSWAAVIELRAERDGAAEGRVYSIVCEVVDASGNDATASCVVVVPHDRRKK